MNKNPSSGSMKVAFFLVEDFSLMAFSSMIEPMRSLNAEINQNYFSWVFISESGAPVRASNGVTIVVDSAMADLEKCDVICICTGLNEEKHASEDILQWLRLESRKGRMIGALSTGTIFLAKAGLLFGKRCTIHWQHIDGFREMFPDLNATGNLYEVDGNCFSCAGGIAAFDLTLSWIADRFGVAVKTAVSDQFLNGAGREPEEPQKNDIVERYGVYNHKLLSVISRMETNLEEPLSRSQLASFAKVTVRQMERLFSKHLNASPSQFYIQLRLRRSREFLRQTAMPVSEIAIACGFVNFSHFAHSYRNQFGCSPTEERDAIKQLKPKN